MLDLRLIREQPEEVERALALRGEAVSLRPVVEADAARRRLLTEAEELKAERNRASEAIGQAKRRGESPEAAMARVRDIGERIKALDAQVKDADARLEALLVELPNLPHPSVPAGTTEDENVEVRRWGAPRRFEFEPKPHEVLGVELGRPRRHDEGAGYGGERALLDQVAQSPRREKDDVDRRQRVECQRPLAG